MAEWRIEHREKGRPRKGKAYGSCSRRPEHGLKSFICRPSLVNPLGSCIPSSQISVYRFSKEHGSDLALDIQFEASAEFDNQGPGVHVSGVQGQDQETVQVIVYCLVSLIVRGLFQSIDSICLRVDQKELTLELLFKISPESDGKDASVRCHAGQLFRQ